MTTGIVKKYIKNLFNLFGYDILSNKYPHDLDPEFRPVYEKLRSYTMTPMESMYALYKATEYISRAKIPGSLVECGVWRGGSTMLMAKVLLKNKEKNRKIYLYDTFKGMTKPSEKDIRLHDSALAQKIWSKQKKNNHNDWCLAPLEEVRVNLRSTGYSKNKLVFVQGMVEKTLPKIIPKKIALLRLDTDWYKSTYHELKYLFPLLSKGGVIVIDDYGCWSGAKKAVDTYFQKNNVCILLNRINSTIRVGIKG